jgi:tetratricopeptide (TPR) repeat protein
LLSPDGETLLASSGYTGDPTVVTFKWHLTMARALLMLNRVDEAAPHLQRVLRERPDYTEAHLFYAEWLRRKGDYEQASQHYEMASRNPQIALAALQDAANMWWEQKRFDRALPFLARLAELQPEQEAWWHRWVHARNRRAIIRRCVKPSPIWNGMASPSRQACISTGGAPCARWDSMQRGWSISSERLNRSPIMRTRFSMRAMCCIR